MSRKFLDRYSRIKPAIVYVSAATGIPMFCESVLEFDRLFEHEFDPDVTRFNTQPKSFAYTKGRRSFRYTPDTLLRYADGHYAYEEVKSEEEANSPGFQRKFAYLQDLFLERIGIPLHLHARRCDYNHPRRINLRRLYGFLRHTPDPEYLGLLTASLGQAFTFGSATECITAANRSLFALYVLLAHKQVTFDFDHPLTPETALEVSHG